MFILCPTHQVINFAILSVYIVQALEQMINKTAFNVIQVSTWQITLTTAIQKINKFLGITSTLTHKSSHVINSVILALTRAQI
jgi:hypothetical protein